MSNAPADQAPREAFLAEHLILWIDEYDCGVGLMDVHYSGSRYSRCAQPEQRGHNSIPADEHIPACRQRLTWLSHLQSP